MIKFSDLVIFIFVLYHAASIFGQHLRLEPLHADKKIMWKREMNCFLSICDYIVEFVPTLQDLQDGTIIEVKIMFPLSFSLFGLAFFQGREELGKAEEIRRSCLIWGNGIRPVH